MQELDRGVEVVDVERDVVATDVAVARLVGVLVRRGVLEHLEDRLPAAAEEVQLLHHRAGVHVEVLVHPVAVVVAERPERVHVLAAQHVDQEGPRLLEVGDGEADVVDAGQAGEGGGHGLGAFRPYVRIGPDRIQ